mgnify:CR=1 FL=1
MTSRTGESESPQAPPREQWSGQLGFLMAAIGSAIGLGNIWRFPGVAYTNGGGAFVVPYVIALLAAGLPILLLDYALGHRFRGSTPAVFRRMSSKLEWLGWFQVFICFVIMTYYAVVVAWSLRYTLFSISTAWGADATGFFQHYIGMDRLGSEVGYSPSVVMGVAVPLLFVWAFGMVVTALGVSDGVEKANKIFLPLLVLMFVVLVVRALLLPGAGEGLNALFTPEWSALRNYRVWMAALGQIFFSLSVGFGIMLTYSSYLRRRRSNLVGTGLVAGFANSSFELLAGIGVFATLGFMANTQGTSVDKLENIAGPALSFITFPTVISQMPGGALFGVFFFASFAIAGAGVFGLGAVFTFAVFADAVGDVVDHVQPRNALLVQVVHGMRVFFAKDGHQHVGAGHFFLAVACALHVHDGALNYALKAQRGLGIHLFFAGQGRVVFLDKVEQARAQIVGIGGAGLEHLRGRGVIQQGE